MTADMVALIGIAAIMGLVTVVIVVNDVAYRNNELAPIEWSVTPERPKPSAPQLTPQLVYTHAAPGRPFTARGAHRAMQEHLECSPGYCPRKREAIDMLIRCGRLVPRHR
jgi:hypothetical protein